MKIVVTPGLIFGFFGVLFVVSAIVPFLINGLSGKGYDVVRLVSSGLTFLVLAGLLSAGWWLLARLEKQRRKKDPSKLF